MKKFWIMVLALATLQMTAQAQTQQKKSFEKQWICVGVKGGMSVQRMLYWHNTALGRLPQDTMFFPTGGIFVDIPLSKVLSVAPEVTYVQRGTGLKYTHIGSGSEVHYTLNVHYADLRLPLEIRWPIQPWLQPYFVVGAEAGMRIGGKIAMTRTAPIAMNDTIDVGNANMALLHAGAFAGVGIRSKMEIGRRYLLLKLSASYHQGLVDTYSQMEKQGTSTADNVNAYYVTGARLPQGLELTLGVALSLQSLERDACATFSRDRNHRRHRGSFGY